MINLKTITGRLVLVLFVGLCLGVPNSYAIPESLSAQQQQLTVLQQANTLRQTQLERLQARQIPATKARQLAEKDLQRAKLELAVMKADRIAVDQTLLAAQKRLEYLQLNMHQAEVGLEQQVDQAVPQLRSQVVYQSSLFQLQRQRLQALHQAQRLMTHIQTLQQAWVDYTTEQYEIQQQAKRQAKFVAMAQQVKQQQANLLKKLSRLNQRAKTLPALQLSNDIFVTQQDIDMSQLKLTLTDLTNRIETLPDTTGERSLHVLDTSMRKMQALIIELQNLADQLDAKRKLLNARQKIQTQTATEKLLPRKVSEQFQQALQRFQQRYTLYQTLVHNLLLQTQQNQVTVRRDREHVLSLRRDLPSLQWSQWLAVGKDFLQVQNMTWQAVITLGQHTQIHWQALHASQKFSFSGIAVLWLLIWLGSKPILNRLSQHLRDKRQRSSTTSLFTLVELLRRNSLLLVLFGAFWSLLYSLDLAYSYYNFILYVLLVIIVTRGLIGIGRIYLLDTMGDASGSDVRMYHHLKRVLISAGVILAITILVYQLPAAYVVQNIMSRIFMLFVLFIAWVLWKSRHTIPSLVMHGLPGRAYLARMVWLLAYAIPLILFADAIIGISGYLQLVWILGYYQLVVLCVLVGYIILRGLWGDLNDSVAGLLIQHIRNGWLWSEALLKPIDRLGRFLLIVATVLAAFVAFGWEKNNVLFDELQTVLHYRLLTLLDADITLLHIIEAVLVLAVFYWLVRWVREFAYRWLFSRIDDKSLRNSLAIFSQYAMVALGLIVILRVLGIGFTGISVVLGGLAVGIGFGLRDLANNFVSGVLLLIERPMRVNDYVTIGEHTGDVIHIGMRSLVLKTLDHTEVVIPNSEVFSHAFSNWTRLDSIVRASLTIRIQRTDNPFRVQALIYDVVTAMPTVVTEPAPTVYLQDIEQGLIEFKVAYFVDLTKGYTRPRIRSEVLLAIWNRFTEIGIKPAYPQQELHIRNQ